ncbi:MAG: hypothetical protein FWD47_09670 [Treponema sp.]|nr:hypothetical protein [Treponema sp.]
MLKFFIFLFILINFTPVFGLDLPVSRISDDSLLRIRFKESWMLETPSRVLSQRSIIEQLETGERVQISAQENNNEFMVLFSRELIRGRAETDTTAAAERRATGQFPGWAQGSWMLIRRKDTGDPTLIRVFLRSDQNMYIQFRPISPDRSQMDVVIYGAIIARSIPVAVGFERLYTMRLNDIIRLADNKFPLRYFEPDIANYRDTNRLISQVRPHLSGLRFADDGAIDENGNYVLIESLYRQNPNTQGLNCSGFVKWFIDGILRPITGRRLQITPLKAPFGQRGSSFTENWEESRDVFFGLDWIRNLASEANRTLRSPSYMVLEEFEVRRDNFSLLMVNQNRNFTVHSYPGFMDEAGYSIEGLHPLLYTLAIDEPFSFYLAAISNEIANPSNPRGTPRLRQYYHVAVLIPYFDEAGIFRIVVFESAAETSFTSFRNRYPGHFINLVRIPVTTRFTP